MKRLARCYCLGSGAGFGANDRDTAAIPFGLIGEPAREEQRAVAFLLDRAYRARGTDSKHSEA